MADAAEELDVVALEAHAGATAEAEAAAGELVADLLDGGAELRRRAGHDGPMSFLATLLPETVTRKIPLILVWLIPFLAIPYLAWDLRQWWFHP